jgi:hypothetical protein
MRLVALLPGQELSTAIASVILLALLSSRAAPAQTPIPALHKEGLVHGFLVLRNTQGDVLADGEFSQTARGERVTSHVVFRFRDGSLHEETTAFSQRGSFQLQSSHLVQKGPTFKNPTEVSINGKTGQISVRYTDDDGKEKKTDDRLKLPTDTANGMLLTIVKNILPGSPQSKVSLLAITPKPRIVKLLISPDGEEPFAVGSVNYKATRYLIKFELGGIAGVVAPIVGKQPQDMHVWIMAGDAPGFVRLEGPLYPSGPTWRIELAGTDWRESADK